MFKHVVKVNSSLCLVNYAPRQEDVSGSGGIAPPFLNSALYGGEWPVSRPGRFDSGERANDTHWIGGWVSPRAGLDATEKRKTSCPCLEWNPDRPASSPSVLSRIC
jgi:hypothetical protein